MDKKWQSMAVGKIDLVQLDDHDRGVTILTNKRVFISGHMKIMIYFLEILEYPTYIGPLSLSDTFKHDLLFFSS